MVAQGIEHQTSNLLVVGSIPTQGASRRQMNHPYSVGMTKTQTTVYPPYIVSQFNSSVLESAVFSPSKINTEQGDLIINFKSGRTYLYPVVSAGNFIGLIMAESAGKYFNANIRHLNSVECPKELQESARKMVNLLTTPLVTV